MSESYMWRSIRPWLSKASLDPVRVENSAYPGTPDVNFVDGWMELKYIRAWPKRDRTFLSIDHYTASQRVWIKRRAKKGGRVFLLLKVGKKEWYLFRGGAATDALYTGEVNRKNARMIADKYWLNGIDKSELVFELIKPLPGLSSKR